MAHGPFQTKEGGDTIAIFTKDELLPCIKRIRELAIETSQFRVGFWSSILRKSISGLEEKHKKTSVQFINLYHKWSTPDLLFQALGEEYKKPPKLGNIMGDYFNAQNAVMAHFNEGFRLLAYVDRILTEQSTAIYNRISVTLSIIAVTISIIVAILK